MTTLPTQMVDRWHNRAEPGPGKGTVYWHMLMNDHPQVVDLARDTQQRLARFPGLHMTPLDRLHMTMLLAGPADRFSKDQLQEMIAIASAMLADTPTITVTVGGILYHPEAIMLAVKPRRALTNVHDAAQAATRAVTDGHDPDGDAPPWIPHITVCYSTANQDMAPITAALGPQQRECQIQISTVSLVIQHGPERLWNWHTVGAVGLQSAAQTLPWLVGPPYSDGWLLSQQFHSCLIA
jgi:2'-5' RNA ligase